MVKNPKLHEVLVQIIKWGVAGLVGWAATRGWDTSWAPALEQFLVLALSAVVNVAMNWIADQLRSVPWLAGFLNLFWPNPNYSANDLPPSAP